MNIRILEVFAVLLLVLAAGCGQQEDAKTATQVAARVNAEEITVHQVNHVLARGQKIAPEFAARAKREILDRLIDQQLARQRAIENKLDRSPNVMQAIKAARSEILARAYLEQLAAALARPKPSETQKYYSEHPELFAERRMFDLEEFVLAVEAEVAAQLREKLPEARSMREIADWLRSRNVNFVGNFGVRAAEQISVEMLPMVQAMKEGQIQMFDAGGGRYQVIRMVASRAAPMDEASATAPIEQYLLNRRAGEMLVNEMKKLKQQAKIEFAGEFAGGVPAQAKDNADTATPAAPKPKSGIDGLIQ